MESPDKEKLVKNEIMDAALALFQKYGYNKTTMEDIAKSAKKSKSTLYQHFSSKDELLKYITTVSMQESLAKAISAVSKCSTAEEQLKAYFNTTYNNLKEKTLLFDLLISDLKETMFIFVSELKEEIDEIELSEIKAILRRGILFGEFSKNHADKLDLIAYYLLNTRRGIMGDVARQAIHKKNFWKDGVVDLDILVDFFVKGLR